MERHLANGLGHGVRQLDLATRALFQPGKVFEHIRRQHIAPDDGQVGRGVFRGGLFNQSLDLDHPAIIRTDIQDAVAAGLFARHFGHGQHVAARLVIDLRKLGDAGGLAQHDVIGQQDGERIIADELARAPDGVAQPQRFLLADGHHGAGHDAGRFQRLERGCLVAGLQRVFKFVADIEIIDQGVLAPAGNKAEFLDPRLARLIDCILDQRAINDREHFLGHRLRRGEKACSQTGNRQYGFFKGLNH